MRRSSSKGEGSAGEDRELLIDCRSIQRGQLCAVGVDNYWEMDSLRLSNFEGI